MPTNSDKWRFTLYTVIMVILLFNNYAFIAMNRLVGKFIPIYKNGCSTLPGFTVHLMIFTLVLRYSMDLG